MATLVDLEEADTGQPVIERPRPPLPADATPAERLRYVMGA